MVFVPIIITFAYSFILNFIKMDIRENIKREIQSHGMTLAQVAQKMPRSKGRVEKGEVVASIGTVGITQGALSQLLNNPTTNTLFQIASILHCDVADFFYGTSGRVYGYIHTAQGDHTPKSISETIDALMKHDSEECGYECWVRGFDYAVNHLKGQKDRIDLLGEINTVLCEKRSCE